MLDFSAFARARAARLQRQTSARTPSRAHDACVRSERSLIAPAHYTFRRDGDHCVGPLHLALEPGELILLTGKNGVGKSTLLSGIAGCAARLRAGNDSNLDRKHRFDSTPLPSRHTLLWVEQAALGLGANQTTRERLILDAALLGAAKEARAWAEEALRVFSLPSHQALATLSQGQRRQATLARLAFPAARPLWLLDEPFELLDASACEIVASCIARHLARGGGVMLAVPQGDAEAQAYALLNRHAVAPRRLTLVLQ